MWFKNCLIYRFNRQIQLLPNEIEQKLAEFSYKPCTSQEQQKTGWRGVVNPNNELFTHVVGDNILICAQKEEKLLPAQVIKDALAEKISQKEQQEGRALKKAEKETLKDEILIDLMPRAFSKYQHTYVLIMPKLDFVLVDTSSTKRAEDILALLRKSLGSLPVVPAIPETPIESTLTHWVQTGEVPQGYLLGDEAVLESVLEDGAILRCKKQELDAQEILHHLQANKVVTELSLHWQERLQFILTQNGALKRLKFSHELTEQNDDIDKDDKDQRFDADAHLMCSEMQALLPHLFESLGGFSS